MIFLQSFFERSAEISTKDRLVVLSVSSFHLLNVLRLLKELGVATHIFGTEPVTIAVSVDDAARVPLFNPKAESEKYMQVVSLVSKQ
ncbi:MAG: hypothetical protein OK474_04180 [Thaumarchaeota archaeon]|nr:hypothetical protein [Nitrososphaerota archaeon]